MSIGQKQGQLIVTFQPKSQGKHSPDASQLPAPLLGIWLAPAIGTQ